MPWITLTEAAVASRLAAKELAAIKTAATSPGQEHLLSEAIAQVVREVRGYVAACPSNTLGPDGTVPDELELAALNRIRYELATRLPVASLLTQARTDSNTAATAIFKEVAACRFKLVQPVQPGTQPSASLEGYHGSDEKIPL
jgi:hypothetical protein